MKHIYYVMGDNGQYYVLCKSRKARFGFYLCQDDQTWDGGLGTGAQSWERVPSTMVPRSFKRALGRTLIEILAEIDAD
jgi:hypothetical protein